VLCGARQLALEPATGGELLLDSTPERLQFISPAELLRLPKVHQRFLSAARLGEGGTRETVDCARAGEPHETALTDWCTTLSCAPWQAPCLH
jgi:hypothetical protein